MNPLGVFSVAGIMLAFLVYRWWALHRLGQYRASSEWPYWLFAAAAVAVAVGVTFAGRLVMLTLTPIVLVPSGAYLVARSSSLPRVGRLDLRSAGWLAIVTGVLGGLAAIAEVVR